MIITRWPLLLSGHELDALDTVRHILGEVAFPPCIWLYRVISVKTEVFKLQIRHFGEDPYMLLGNVYTTIRGVMEICPHSLMMKNS